MDLFLVTFTDVMTQHEIKDCISDTVSYCLSKFGFAGPVIFYCHCE